MEYTGFLANTNISNVSYNNHIITFSINNMADGDIVQIKFLVRLKCNILNNYTQLSMGLRLNYSGASGAPIHFKSIDYINKVNAPSLLISAIGNPNNSNGIVGTNYTRKWKVVNNKIGSEIDTTRLRIVYQNGTAFSKLKINGNIVSAAISGDTIRYNIIQKLRNINDFNGDSILIEETYTITNCFTSSGSSTISMFYGCFNTLYCKEFFQTAATQTQVTVPVLNVTSTWQYGCKGSYDTLNLRIANTGSGIARNVIFDVNGSYGDYFVEAGNPSAFLDSASSLIKKGINGNFTRIYKTSAVQYSFTRSYWSITRPTRLINYTINQINNGDTLYFKLLYYNPCINASTCSINEKSVNTYFSYQNNCLNNTFIIPRRNIRHERSDGAFKIEGPTDINVGDTSTYTISMAPNSSTGYRYDAKGYLMFEVSYANGLSWVNNTSDLTLKRLSDASIDAADSVYHDVSNRKIKIFYRFNATTNNIFNNRSSYFIKPRFTLDCSGSPSSSGSISISAFEKRDLKCNTACLEPFGCALSYAIVLHCPYPCPRGGFSPYSATLQRTTIGLPDNNQDGLPDAAGSTLDYSKLELNKVVALDTFVIKYKGIITRGPQSPAQFSFGYGESKFPTIGYLVNVIKADVIIKDSSSNSKFTVSNLTYTTTNSGNDRTFKWNFSSNISGFPSGYYFDSRDSIEVQCTYVFNPLAINYGSDISNTIDNIFYVSPYANPTSDTAKYRCDRYNNLLKTVTNYYTVYNPDNFNWNGCGSYIAYYRAYLSIGECCSNYNGSIHFPYEYRTYGFWDSLRVFTPAGFTIDSANLYFSNGTKVGNANSIYRYSVTPVSTNSNSQLYAIGNYFTPRGGTIVPSRGGFYGHMQVYFKPSCKTPIATPLQRNSDYTFKSINTWASRTNNFNSDPYPKNASWNAIKNYGSGTTVFNGPSLDISNFGAVSKQYSTNTTSYDIKIQNNNNIADASNVWIAAYSKSGLMKIDSVKNTTTNALISQVGGVYRIGSIAKNAGNIVLKVFTNQMVCNNDSLTIYTGWNCNGYPNVFNSSLCVVDSAKVFLLNNTSNLAIQFQHQPTTAVPLCDTFAYQLSVSQLQNIALKSTFLDVQLPNLGNGISIVPNTTFYNYPSNSSFTAITPQNMGNGVFRFNVSDSNNTLKNNGLKTFNETPKNGYQLKMTFKTTCDFVSGSEIRFIAQGKNYCGQNVPNDVRQSTVDIQGAPVRKLYFSTSSIPELKPCNKAVEISVKIKNLQNTRSTKNDNLYITLPSGVLYQSNTCTFIKNRFSDTIPSISLVGDRQQLTWVADSIPQNDSAVLKIKIYSPDNIPCGTNPYLEVQTRSSYVASCNSINCFSQVQNSLEKILTTIKKPDITFLTGNAQVIKDTTLGNIYASDTLKVSNLTFTNNGNDTGNLKLYFFNDSNHNNLYDNGEQIFFTDSIQTFVNGSNRSYSKTLINGKNYFSDTVKVLGVVKCNCSKNDFIISPVFNYIPLSIGQLQLEGEIHGNTSQLWFASIPDVANYTIERKLNTESSFYTLSEINSYFQPIVFYNDLFQSVECMSYDYRIKAISSSGKLIYSNTVSLSNCNLDALKLVPNPVSNLAKLNIYNYNPNNIQIAVYDALGKKQIIPIEIINNSFEFDFSTLNNGIYTIQLQYANGKQKAIKFVVNH